MSREDLIALARAAGRRGVAWSDWPDELTEEQIDEICRTHTSDLEAAHLEGRREYLIADKGWHLVWTTAPEAYDTCGTFAVEGPFEWERRQLRRVAVDPGRAAYQIDRYASGCHYARAEDPREVDRRIREELSRARVEKAMRGFRAAAGAAWLASLSDEELENYDKNERDELLRGFGLTWEQHRHVLGMREDERKWRATAAKWARCRALVPDGATLIDEGTSGAHGTYGWIPGRKKDAWRSIKVEPHYGYPDDADEARVVGEGPMLAGTYIGSLAHVAALIAKGEMRLARPDEHVPPRKVVERIRCTWDEVLRVETGGRVVWVASRFGEMFVLDDGAHHVRAKKVREEAITAYRSSGRY